MRPDLLDPHDFSAVQELRAALVRRSRTEANPLGGLPAKVKARLSALDLLAAKGQLTSAALKAARLFASTHINPTTIGTTSHA